MSYNSDSWTMDPEGATDELDSLQGDAGQGLEAGLDDEQASASKPRPKPYY